MRGNYLKRRFGGWRIRVLKKGKTFLFFNMVFATLEGMEFIFAWMNFYGRKNKIMLK